MLHVPKALKNAPQLSALSGLNKTIKKRSALLINPFYAKDPHASFGKHVLTPTLALTSIAAATPSNWSVEYWDENLLQGHPPFEPLPEVVGITVHLTFALRAYELAKWYRDRRSLVVLGGAECAFFARGSPPPRRCFGLWRRRSNLASDFAGRRGRHADA